MKENLFGLMAEFKGTDDFLFALKKIKEDGFVKIEAYSPYPVDGTSDYIPDQTISIGWFTFGSGILGVIIGFVLQYWVNVVAYPINIGGRPLNSWPAFMPICFELGILFAGLGSIFFMFYCNKLPMPYHPVFNADEFNLATKDRFFITIEVSDPQFNAQKTKLFLEGLTPLRVVEVQA